MRPTICRLALVAAALGLLLAPASASAVATAKQIEESVSKGVTYVKGQQNESGEIAGFGGDWALASLAAVGVAAADVNIAGKEGKDARSWYEGVVGVSTWPGEGAVSTDFERAALASYAAGIDPARVSKRQNLIAKIASYYQPESPGYYGSTFNATVFGLLALANVEDDRRRQTGAADRPRPGGRSGESQPAHRRRLDLGKSRRQRSGAEKSVRTRPDRRRDGGALQRRRRQHERDDRQREGTTSNRSSKDRPAPSNRRSATTPTPTPGRSTASKPAASIRRGRNSRVRRRTKRRRSTSSSPSR